MFIFTCSSTGQSYFLILPSVNTPLMSLALQEFAQDINPHQDKVIVLLLDNAGWHTSKELQLPPALVLLHLPAYTPQLAPAETVVPLLREVAANRSFADLDELETTLGQRCVYLL